MPAKAARAARTPLGAGASGHVVQQTQAYASANSPASRRNSSAMLTLNFFAADFYPPLDALHLGHRRRLGVLRVRPCTTMRHGHGLRCPAGSVLLVGLIAGVGVGDIAVRRLVGLVHRLLEGDLFLPDSKSIPATDASTTASLALISRTCNTGVMGEVEALEREAIGGLDQAAVWTLDTARSASSRAKLIWTPFRQRLLGGDECCYVTPGLGIGQLCLERAILLRRPIRPS